MIFKDIPEGKVFYRADGEMCIRIIPITGLGWGQFYSCKTHRFNNNIKDSEVVFNLSPDRNEGDNYLREITRSKRISSRIMRPFSTIATTS